jgi:hypothetical protein
MGRVTRAEGNLTHTHRRQRRKAGLAHAPERHKAEASGEQLAAIGHLSDPQRLARQPAHPDSPVAADIILCKHNTISTGKRITGVEPAWLSPGWLDHRSEVPWASNGLFGSSSTPSTRYPARIGHVLSNSSTTKR